MSDVAKIDYVRDFEWVVVEKPAEEFDHLVPRGSNTSLCGITKSEWAESKGNLCPICLNIYGE